MSASRLVRMTAPITEGWDKLVGTFWVLGADGRTLRHTTERQTQLKVTLKKGADWREFFEDASNPSSPTLDPASERLGPEADNHV